LNDLYSLNLHKMDTFQCLIEAIVPEWLGEESGDEDEDEEGDDDEESDSGDDEESDESEEEEKDAKKPIKLVKGRKEVELFLLK
jgi:hypothetical protein